MSDSQRIRSPRPLVSLGELSTKPPTGIRCPQCGCGHFDVLKTVDRQGGYRGRRKVCRNCGHRITTSERLVGG